MVSHQVWMFFISSHANPNNIPCGLRLIDEELVERDNGINESFYGFRVDGTGFAIDGYIKFIAAVDEEFVNAYMPGFQLVPYPDHAINKRLHQVNIKEVSIFTKFRCGITGLTPTIAKQEDWQYMEQD